MKNISLILSILVLSFISCQSKKEIETQKAKQINYPKHLQYISYFENKENFVVEAIRYPVGLPEMHEYEVSRPYGYNGHLGCDFGRIGQSDADLGDPIYCIANGYVLEAENMFRSWGNTIWVLHKTTFEPRYFVSVYAHCDTMLVEKGEYVNHGQVIGTIGNASGLYRPHLHFEIRSEINSEYSAGYSKNNTGYLEPVEFIKTMKEQIKK